MRNREVGGIVHTVGVEASRIFHAHLEAMMAEGYSRSEGA